MVLTGKVPEDCPDGMMMVAGTVAVPLSLLSVTVTPAEPAGAPSVTVPVDDVPPTTGFGAKPRPVMVPLPGLDPPGRTVSVAVFLLLTEDAVIVAVVETVTVLVESWKVADNWPAGTITTEGTVTAGLSLTRRI